MRYGKTVSELPVDFVESLKLCTGGEVKLATASEEEIAKGIHLVATDSSGMRMTLCVISFDSMDHLLAYERKVAGKAKAFWQSFLSSIQAEYVVGIDDSGMFPVCNWFLACRDALLEMLSNDEPVKILPRVSGTFFHFFVLIYLDKETAPATPEDFQNL